MIEPSPATRKRLLFLLHRACNEARELATTGKIEQLADLAEAIHEIPSRMVRWTGEDMDAIRRDMSAYLEKHPGAKRFQYLEFLDRFDPPDSW